MDNFEKQYDEELAERGEECFRLGALSGLKELEKVKHIVGFSGGIDSQACARWVLNRFDPANVILLNSDAGGNEHPLTVEFIREYAEKIHPVTYMHAIVADMWGTAGFAEKRGYDGNAVLDWPTMIEIKGRAPSPLARFCTDKLKIQPQLRWLKQNFGPGGQFNGWDYVRYTGVRREESQKRKETQFQQWDSFYDCPLFAPLMDWTKQMCFDYVQAHGEPINELYKLGFGRVGCAPCINSGREDIRNWAMRFSAMIDKIREWEKRSGRTFFAPMVPGKYMNNIDEVVEWAMCDVGGKQHLFPIMIERKECESKYGLCE
jgi:3'-phosphoadenosine 5'-phosphosulfate sulfotransferase (PAPS reductase)/FAD synthetase